MCVFITTELYLLRSESGHMVFYGTYCFTREFSCNSYFAIKASNPCSINHVFFSAISLASFSASDVQCKEGRQGVLGGTAYLGQLITQEIKQ